MATIRLNLGCGLFPLPGVLNLDSDPTLPKQWEKDPETNAWLQEAGVTAGEMSFEARDPKDLSHLAAGSVEVVHVGYLLSDLEVNELQELLRQIRWALSPAGGELVIQGLEGNESIEETLTVALLDLDFTVEELWTTEEGTLVTGGDNAVTFVGLSAFLGDNRVTFLGEPVSEEGTDDWDEAERQLEAEESDPS